MKRLEKSFSEARNPDIVGDCDSLNSILMKAQQEIESKKNAEETSRNLTSQSSYVEMTPDGTLSTEILPTREENDYIKMEGFAGAKDAPVKNSLNLNKHTYHVEKSI